MITAPEVNVSPEFVRIGNAILNLNAVAYVTYETGRDLFVYLREKDDKGRRLFVRVSAGQIAGEVAGFFEGRGTNTWLPQHFNAANLEVPGVSSVFPNPPPTMLATDDGNPFGTREL